jgi:hypothetical protein
MSILEKLQPKPRTTVKRFAAELKTRISKVEAAFSRDGQEQFVSCVAYVKGIIDALCSDYDVRDPEDFIARPPEPPRGMAARSLRPGERCTFAIQSCNGEHEFCESLAAGWDGRNDIARCSYVEPAAVPLKEPTCGTCGDSKLDPVSDMADMRSCPDCARTPEVTR